MMFCVRLKMAAFRLTMLVLAVLGTLAGVTGGAFAHSVSMGYVVSSNGVVTIYYGGYHAGVPPEGDITLTQIGGGYASTLPASATTSTRPSGLVDGTNNFLATSCISSGSVRTAVIWQSATFTGVPSGQFTIQLTGSFTINWEPCSTSISSPTSIVVIDAAPPVISGLPSNMTLNTPPGSSTAMATWTPPTASDDVGLASFTTSHAPGTNFPIGTTTVTYTATDTSGNVTTGSFTVTVIDNVPPVLTGMPANITLAAPSNGSTAVATWTPPTASDNSGSVTVTSSHPPGSSFPIGTTTVTYTVRDASGNEVQSSFTVTVTDSTGPVIGSCPANQTREATGPSGATATWSVPTASDNSGAVITLTGSHSPGATFPLGITTVTYTGADPTGNAATPCTFTITVRDTTGPSIAPQGNVVATAPTLAGAIVTYNPTATDAVSGTPTITTSPPSGTLLGVGTHTVTVTATDAEGNQSQTTFTVTVLAPAQLSVSPGTDFLSQGPQGQQGAPFAPATQNYTVSNNGQEPMAFAITGAPAWLSLSPSTGTIPAGGTATVTAALTAAADLLAVGTFTAPLTFTNTTRNIGDTTLAATLLVQAPANMNVTPATAFLSSGPRAQLGGAFTPSSTTYVVQNTGALPMTFTVSGAPSWATVAPSGGTIPAGGSQVVTLALNTAADGLPLGAHTATLAFTNTTNNLGSTTRDMTLNVVEPARLTVTPAEGLVANGYQGGPFSPASKVYTLTNTGGTPLSFTASDDRAWLDVAPASGTIPPGGTVTVTLSVNANANVLASGTHTGTLTLTNTTSGIGSTTRSASLTAIPNGQVILRVVTTDGDGTFRFSSAATGLNVSVSTSGGAGQSQPVTLNPATYTTVLTPPDGFGLTSITCSDSDSRGNVGAKSATIVLASSEVVTCTFASANSRKKTVEVISNFMSRRNEMLLQSGPDNRRQIDRLIEAGDAMGASRSASTSGAPESSSAPSRLGGEPIAFGSALRGAPGEGRRGLNESTSAIGGERHAPSRGESPMANGGTDNEGTGRLAFGTSLGEMMRLGAQANERKLQAAAGSPDAVLPAPTRKPFSPWDVWVQGHYVDFNDRRNKGDTSGHFGVLDVGADYVLNPRLLVGVYAGYDSMHQRSAAAVYDIRGRGWMAGPYATVRLSEHLFLQGRAAMGSSSNVVSPFQTYSDEFTSWRKLASATLTGRWQFGNWDWRPSASVSYIEDKSVAYQDSLGVEIPGVKVALGQFKAGPEVSYRYRAWNGTLIEPRAGLQVIWNFAGSGPAADFGGTLSGPEGVRGKADLGLKTQFTNGTSLDLSTSYDGIGSNGYRAIGGKATLRIPLN